MKILLKLITLLAFFLITLYAENINECKTDIYYGNGIWNGPEDAEESIRELEKIVITPYIIRNDPKLKVKYGEVKLQYNWGQGNMQDVLETYYQLKEAGQVQEYQFFAVIAILTKGDPSLTFDAIIYEKLMRPFTRGWEQGNVDGMWEKYYHESFKLSHKVLLISHSQGGLFANRIYDNINPTKYKDYFANLQVASPASEVKALKGDYVTLSTDLTSVDPAVNFIPGSMSPNVSGGSGHAFISAYLSQIDPLTKIITKTKQLLSDLDTESSQWKLDQEIKKETEYNRITVKHRFDFSITTMDGIEVNLYLLDSPKVLYYNQDKSKYVFASCDHTDAKYKHYRWISYMCTSRKDTELEVDIYGTKDVPSGQLASEELVASDVRQRAFLQNGSCPFSGWDYSAQVSAYDKDNCMAYTFDDTSGNYHSLDYIASQTYENFSTCTVYNMDSNVTEKLRALEK